MKRTLASTSLLLLLGFLGYVPAPAVADTPKVQDPFQALYDVIMVRPVPGQSRSVTNAVAPLLWYDSRFLIEGDTYRKFIQALDKVAALSDEKLEAYSDLQRAVMQRQLWSVFDWTTDLKSYPWAPESHFEVSHQETIQRKVASLIQRLALTKKEILALPNTLDVTATSRKYSETFDAAKPLHPFLPRDLFDENGPWVCLSKSYHRLVAPFHTKSAKWRSVFLIFIRLPGDRKATVGYLNQLADFRDHWVTTKPDRYHMLLPNGGINYIDIYVNPETPQFPVGTQVALVEQALLISDEGELVVSPLFPGVQLRAYLKVDGHRRPGGGLPQAMAEFVMQPRLLMQGNAQMRAIGRNDKVYESIVAGSDTLLNKDRVQRSRGATLETCISCHAAAGIHSVNSRSQLFENRNLLPPRFRDAKPNAIYGATIDGKKKDYSWGLLQGLRRIQP